MRIQIDSSDTGYSLAGRSGNCLAGGICYTADFCLRSKVFSLLTLGHLHTLIHEMGHAITYEVLSGGKATIHISTKSCYGSTSFSDSKRSLSPIAET